MNLNYKTGILCLVLLSIFSSCDKTKVYDLIAPPAQAHFLTTSGSYYVTNTPNSVFKIPVGLTKVSDTDTKITITASSSTGAASGVQYNIPAATITIPAGKAIDSLAINGIFAGYAGTRKDTLTLTISGGDLPSTYNTTYKLVLQKYCDVNSTDLIGNYANSTDFYNGSPSTKANYIATISGWVPVTATSATINIKNLGATSDNGWGPFTTTDPSRNPGLTATLNWSNPAAFTVTIPLQNYFNDSTGMSTISASGTFSSCDQTFTIVASVKYAGTGSTYTHTSVFRR